LKKKAGESIGKKNNLDMKNKKVIFTAQTLYNICMNIDELDELDELLPNKNDEYVKESELFARGWTGDKKKWLLWGGKELTKKDEEGNVLYLKVMVEQIEHVHRSAFDKRIKTLNKKLQEYGKTILRRF